MSKEIVSQEISRRRFLQLLSGFGLSIAFGELALNQASAQSSPEPVTPAVSTESETRFTFYDLFTNPVKLVDVVAVALDQKRASGQLISEAEASYLDSFGFNPTAQDRKTVLTSFFSPGYPNLNFGERLYYLYQDIQNNELGEYMLLVGVFWEPLFQLMRVQEGFVDVVTAETVLSLENLVEWLRPMTAFETYQEQKNAYLERARGDIELRGLFVRLDEQLNQLTLAVAAGEEAQNWSPAALQLVISIVDAFDDYFPGALQGIDAIEVSMSETGRAYAEIETNSIFLNKGVNSVIQLAEQYQATGDENFNYSAQFELVAFLRMLIHEVGHGYNPDFQYPSLKQLHPEDLFVYIRQYVSFLSEFRSTVAPAVLAHGENPVFSAEDWEYFFNDPMGTKVYGVDQLVSEEQFSVFDAELTQLSQFFNLIDQLKNDAPNELFNSLETSRFFDASQQTELLVWQVWKNQALSSFLKDRYFEAQVSEYLQTFDMVSHLSAEHMAHFSNQFAILNADKESRDPFIKSEIFSAFLEIKSFYILMAHITLERITPRLVEFAPYLNLESFYASRYAFKPLVFQKIIHTFVGPLGEYMFMPGQQPSLADLPSKQVETVAEIAQSRREYLQLQYGWLPSNKAVTLLESWYGFVAEAQSSRAALWFDPDMTRMGEDSFQAEIPETTSYAQFERYVVETVAELPYRNYGNNPRG